MEPGLCARRPGGLVGGVRETQQCVAQREAVIKEREMALPCSIRDLLRGL